MNRAILCLIVLWPFCAGTVHSQSHKRIWKSERTYSGQVSDSSPAIQSETFGYAAEAFIPDCEVWLFGKLVEPVSSPDDKDDVGIIITKSPGQIEINGNVLFLNVERPEPDAARSPEPKGIGDILEAALSEFRESAKKSPDLPDTYIAAAARPSRAVSPKRVQTLQKTYTGDLVDAEDWLKNESFGHAARAFIPDCDICLHGEFLDPVQSPFDANEYGALIEKTKNKVFVNGKVYISFAEPGPHVFTEEKVRRNENTVKGYAAKKFREDASPSNDVPGAYKVGGQLFRPGVPTVFVIDEKHDSVTVTVAPKYMGNTDYIIVEYRGSKIAYDLYKGPRASAAQLNEQSLDATFRGLTERCEPGRLMLMGRGYVYSYPQSERDRLIRALKQIPALAEPKFRDYRGEMQYEPVTIDGFRFQSEVIRDFVKSGGADQ
jgi:hypothetical protein